MDDSLVFQHVTPMEGLIFMKLAADGPAFCSSVSRVICDASLDCFQQGRPIESRRQRNRRLTGRSYLRTRLQDCCFVASGSLHRFSRRAMCSTTGGRNSLSTFRRYRRILLLPLLTFTVEQTIESTAVRLDSGRNHSPIIFTSTRFFLRPSNS